MMRYIVVVLLFTIFSCSSDGDRVSRRILPTYTGSSGNVIVIMNPSDWKSYSGDAIRHELQKPCDQFLSSEAQFDIDSYGHANFSRLLKKFRNIILVDIASNVREAKIIYKKSVWAKDQLIVNILAKDSSDFINIFNENAQEIKEVINIEDIKRYAKINHGISDPVSVEKVKKKYGFGMDMPKDFHLASESDNHLWFKKEKMEYLSGRGYQVVSNIVLRVAPFNNDSVFTSTYIIHEIDSITGEVIQSSQDDFLKIEDKFDPIVKEVNFKGKYAVDLKALWKFDDPLMGGPFSSLTIHDSINNRIISVDGFVFAPKFNKREYMKQLEAIMYSVEL